MVVFVNAKGNFVYTCILPKKTYLIILLPVFFLYAVGFVKPVSRENDPCLTRDIETYVLSDILSYLICHWMLSMMLRKHSRQ